MRHFVFTDYMSKTVKNSPKPAKISCSRCGLCCKLFLINLTQKEWESGYFKTYFQGLSAKDSFKKARSYGGHLLLQKEDGSCIYLQNNLCSIHQNRPQACRNFFCRTKQAKYRGMVRIINKASSSAP